VWDDALVDWEPACDPLRRTRPPCVLRMTWFCVRPSPSSYFTIYHFLLKMVFSQHFSLFQACPSPSSDIIVYHSFSRWSFPNTALCFKSVLLPVVISSFTSPFFRWSFLKTAQRLKPFLLPVVTSLSTIFSPDGLFPTLLHFSRLSFSQYWLYHVTISFSGALSSTPLQDSNLSFSQ